MASDSPGSETGIARTATGQAGAYPWWIENSIFSIPALWPLPSKQVVKVAILDTGITRHVDFDFSKITGYNYLSNSADFQTDVNGHGTHCSGIIAARGIKSYGVAPETHLYVAKVCDDFGRPVITAVRNALNDIYLEQNGGNGISVINMSFTLPVRSPADVKIRKEIEDLIVKLSVEKQCLLVCSSGSIDDLEDSFPAKIEQCIAVGSINSGLVRSSFSRITPILDLMAPGEGIISSLNIDSVVKKDGTSQAAAFVSGVCALAMQKTDKTLSDNNMFKKILFQTAWSNSFLLTEYGHGIVDPNRIVQTLKSYVPF